MPCIWKHQHNHTTSLPGYCINFVLYLSELSIHIGWWFQLRPQTKGNSYFQLIQRSSDSICLTVTFSATHRLSWTSDEQKCKWTKKQKQKVIPFNLNGVMNVTNIYSNWLQNNLTKVKRKALALETVSLFIFSDYI